MGLEARDARDIEIEKTETSLHFINLPVNETHIAARTCGCRAVTATGHFGLFANQLVRRTLRDTAQITGGADQTVETIHEPIHFALFDRRGHILIVLHHNNLP